MKTLAEKKQAIKDFVNSKPEGQFATGLYFKSVGNKYVTYISTWGATTIEKMDIDDFIEDYNII
jgi:hypothetical protein